MKTQELFDLTGQVAIVTGGATHLGKAMATSLGELGASVAIASRRRALSEQVAAELRDQGIDCTGFGCDVTVEEEVDALVRQVVELHGKLDVMVCNAGSTAATSYIPEASVEEFTQTWEANVKSAFLCAQAAAREMIPLRYGKLITIGSIHGSLTADKRFYRGLTGFQRSGPSYRAAKGGVINFTRGLAAELGEFGITANCISPGQIIQPGRNPELAERCRLNNPLERSGTPDDLKGAVALLASHAGDWITGHNLIVDGGWSIW